MTERNTIEISEQEPHIDHVFALRRSGHHAVMEWLRDCYRVQGLSVFHANSVYNEHLGWELHSPDPDPEMLLATADSYDVLMANYEDVAYKDRTYSPIFNALRAVNNGFRDIVITRDWYNMVA